MQVLHSWGNRDDIDSKCRSPKFCLLCHLFNSIFNENAKRYSIIDIKLLKDAQGLFGLALYVVDKKNFTPLPRSSEYQHIDLIKLLYNVWPGSGTL